MWMRRMTAVVVGAVLLTTTVGCSEEDIAELDQDGDGFITSVELIGGLFNQLCPEDETPSPGDEPGEEPDSGDGAGEEEEMPLR